MTCIGLTRRLRTAALVVVGNAFIASCIVCKADKKTAADPLQTIHDAVSRERKSIRMAAVNLYMAGMYGYKNSPLRMSGIDRALRGRLTTVYCLHCKYTTWF